MTFIQSGPRKSLKSLKSLKSQIVIPKTIPCEPKETLDSSVLPLETSTDKSVVGFQGIYQYGSDIDYHRLNSDYGWGCAYRSIQNVLKRLLDLKKITSSQFPTAIDDIRKELNLYYNDEIDEEGWLEPHDAYVYMLKKFTISGELYNLNNIDAIQRRNLKLGLKIDMSYRDIDNDTFTEILISWSKGNKIPIVVDDTIYSYVILDYDVKKNKIVIGDPHNDRRTGLKKIAKKKNNAVIYSIDFNKFLKNNKYLIYKVTD